MYADQNFKVDTFLNSFRFAEGYENVWYVEPENYEEEFQILLEIIKNNPGPKPTIFLNALCTRIDIHQDEFDKSPHFYRIWFGIDKKLHLPNCILQAKEKGEINIAYRANLRSATIDLGAYKSQIPQQAHKLAESIFTAFEGVHLEDGVSLHQTIVKDNYGSQGAMDEARKLDEHDDWTKLIFHPELIEVTGIGAAAFFDEKGMRFHLPAYMRLIIFDPIADVCSSMIFFLHHLSDHCKKNFSILTEPQKNAVASLLEYCLEFQLEFWECDADDMRKALEQYWRV